jgi:hypothetical protein
MDSDEEIMMELIQQDEAEAAAHMQNCTLGMAMLLQIRQQLAAAEPRRGGSRRGKAANKDRNREVGALLLNSDYFADDAINTSKEFRRRFRMNKEVFTRIVQGV